MYAEINPNINYNKSLPNNSISGYSNSTGTNYEETPQFSKFQELHGQK